MTTRVDVLIIGAGQAGLVMGRELLRRGRRVLILDAARQVAHAWRSRWDSLRLLTPARFSALPGLPFPGDPDRHPARDEVVAYLEAYVRAFDLPLALDEAVHAVRPGNRDGLLVSTDHARYFVRQVVVATGPFGEPAVPPLAATIPRTVPQIHASRYRNPAQLTDGPVVVVGAGNSGVQIAEELASSRQVTLAVGTHHRALPCRLFGRSIFGWLDATGVMSSTSLSWLGRRATGRELRIGRSVEALARASGVRLTSRVVGVDGEALRTSAGERLPAASIIWATGYRPSYPFLPAAALTLSGHPRHQGGASPLRGLSFIGLRSMRTPGSALLGWVGRDAEWLADRVA